MQTVCDLTKDLCYIKRQGLISLSQGRGFMSDRNYKFTDPRAGIALGVRVVTRSTTTEIAGKTEEGAVKVRLVASPAGSAEANEELITFLAKQLGVEPRKIEIVAGLEKSDKILSIEGVSSLDVEEKLGLV
jgi:uncharacterized protein YggU (UPF0235/DUF167 family)